MSDSASAESPGYAGRTAWARSLAAPLRDFLGTETASSSALLGAALVALAWATISAHSYESLWQTKLAIRIGSAGISLDLRHWVNEGLMSLFFVVVGLEARRELAMGELRDRRRLAMPVFAALGGMLVPILIFVLVNLGRPSVRGWGAAMSTDTAFALGALALLAPRTATRLRVFLLSLAVVDDLAAMVVIGTAYSGLRSPVALIVAVACLVLLLLAGLAPAGMRTALGTLAAIALWVALLKSGLDPLLAGFAVGLSSTAYSPSREDLEQATELTRSFREQPTPALARTARRRIASALSTNERLQLALHPWSGFLIVPLFALANAGVTLSWHLLASALSSPVTLGIFFAYLAGKPIGILLASFIATRPALHGYRPTIGWPSLLAGSTVAAIGFTVSLLIAGLAFHGLVLQEAKVGVLASALIAPLIAAAAFALVARLPARIWARQIAGAAGDLIDLADDVDPGRDHVRGPADARVTLLEYGDFECPFCGLAEQVIRELLADFGHDLRYAWRHLPLNDVHPHAQVAAEASEAAAEQGRFWDYYDALLSHQGALEAADLDRYALAIGLDMEKFDAQRRRHRHNTRITEDIASADASGVSGTPTFFINGRRHHGAYDIETLTASVRRALTRDRLLRIAAEQAA